MCLVAGLRVLISLTAWKRSLRSRRRASTAGPSAAPGRCPQHVTKYRLAAAAEAAGYRACLRCRPYRSPDALDWSGPELVCRGVQLILGGALDGGTEAELGTRLGVSARHLRRLFSAHLGVTPDGLARSARTHFARRLLDETDLSVSEVAFAAGFGSVRQFNRACRDVFQDAAAGAARTPPAERPPGRRGRASACACRTTACSTGARSLGYFEARAIPGVESVSGETYRRTIVAGGEPGVLELLPGGDDHLLLRVHLAALGRADARRRARAPDRQPRRRHGGADRAQLGDDPVVGPLLRKRPGLRVPGTWDPYETGVRAILGQQVSVAGANTLAGRLVERLGTPVPGLDRFGLTHACSRRRETLAEADLADLGLTGARAEAVRSFARAVAEDDDPARPQRRPRPARLLDPGGGRARALDGELHRPAARRARCLADDRSRAPPCARRARAPLRLAGRARGALAAVARARGDAPLAGRELRRGRAA